jgi:hypothetical protein
MQYFPADKQVAMPMLIMPVQEVQDVIPATHKGEPNKKNNTIQFLLIKNLFGIIYIKTLCVGLFFSQFVYFS